MTISARHIYYRTEAVDNDNDNVWPPALYQNAYLLKKYIIINKNVNKNKKKKKNAFIYQKQTNIRNEIGGVDELCVVGTCKANRNIRLCFLPQYA